MLEEYKLFAPTNNIAKTNNARFAKSAESGFDEISADIRNSTESLQFIRVAQKSTVTENEVLLMAGEKYLYR